MKAKKLKIFIIAGEASGDVLGAKIMRSFKNRGRDKRAPNVEFRGIGGANMKDAGLKSIFSMTDLSVMGLTAVLMRLRTLLRRIRQTTAAISEWKPDLVLTIDSPGFAKAVANKIKKLPSCGGVDGFAAGGGSKPKLYHFVAPQVWAWRPGRAKKFAKLFDRLYCFFDFEVPYFTKYGLPTIPVGHPIADGEIRKGALGEFRKRFKIPHGRKIIAMMPGSRPSEVERQMPLFGKVADLWANSGRLVVIPVADTVSKQVRAAAENWKTKPLFILSAHRYVLFRDADTAIAASGTVSAELAILHTPSVVVYKTSWLTYIGFSLLVRVKFVSLVNIIMKKEIYPEFLQCRASVKNVSGAANKILNSKKERNKMRTELAAADGIWSRGGLPASDLIRNDILKTIKAK
jgi:lipid-A-disaccharide synthase